MKREGRNAHFTHFIAPIAVSEGVLAKERTPSERASGHNGVRSSVLRKPSKSVLRFFASCPPSFHRRRHFFGRPLVHPAVRLQQRYLVTFNICGMSFHFSCRHARSAPARPQCPLRSAPPHTSSSRGTNDERPPRSAHATTSAVARLR